MNAIEKKARTILENLNISEPPVPVELVAKKMGAKLTFEPFEGKDDISGMLFRNGNIIIIGINSAHPNTRQRFSIAHEIGHLFLHKKKLFIDKVVRVDFRNATSSMAIDKNEIAANAFAAELLMPKDFIQKEIYREISKQNITPGKEKLIQKLANTFDVSIQAMEFRLINLGFLISQ
ncbi:MAG: ImmA/IrrE family metallo-endopeptidase [Deltaproteobacteria bacterium]|nr:ImmA/IrrE family metallo-endopeptidase [Deltaproteobacteria bacterium]